MKETKNNNWLCVIQAPPELHESIEQFFNALSYKLRHADGWMEGYKYGLNIGQSLIFARMIIAVRRKGRINER